MLRKDLLDKKIKDIKISVDEQAQQYHHQNQQNMMLEQ